MKEIKVLIVDDSHVVRKMLSRELSKNSGITVIGTAPDPYIAREKIVRLNPDVITLDIEMPRMDGITFLKKVMQYKPLPVIIVSTLTARGSQVALEALSLGALDVVSKPGSAFSVGEMSRELAEKIRMAARANVAAPQKRRSAAPDTNGHSQSLKKTTNKIIAIGASTGGTAAILKVLSRFPENAPGVVVVQHMPAEFTANFAKRLDHLCRIRVREAKDNDSVLNGLALLAPGNFHMTLALSGTRYSVRLNQDSKVHHQRPAVDVLFRSVARFAGPNALGILLTGMGADGAQGLKAMKNQGAYAICQDEGSSVVYGMPREAVITGAADISLDINEIARTALRKISR